MNTPKFLNQKETNTYSNSTYSNSTINTVIDNDFEEFDVFNRPTYGSLNVKPRKHLGRSLIEAQEYGGSMDPMENDDYSDNGCQGGWGNLQEGYHGYREFTD